MPSGVNACISHKNAHMYAQNSVCVCALHTCVCLNVHTNVFGPFAKGERGSAADVRQALSCHGEYVTVMDGGPPIALLPPGDGEPEVGAEGARSCVLDPKTAPPTRCGYHHFPTYPFLPLSVFVIGFFFGHKLAS